MAGLPNAELFVEWKTGVPMALADTNRSDFQGAGVSSSKGLVPDPGNSGTTNRYLNETGVWAQIQASQIAGLVTAAVFYTGAVPLVNAGINVSASSSALVINILNVSGSIPTTTSPAIFAFRASTSSDGNFVGISVATSINLTIPSGATLGVTASQGFRLWVIAVNTSGEVTLGVVNCLSGVNILALKPRTFNSITFTTISTGSDSAHVFYGASANTGMFNILGAITYENGLTTIGEWSVNPTNVMISRLGQPYPGDMISHYNFQTGSAALGTTTIPPDDTVPTSSEGTEFMTVTAQFSSKANLVKINSHALLSVVSVSGIGTSTTGGLTIALFQDTTTNALAVSRHHNTNLTNTIRTITDISIMFWMKCNVNAYTDTTYKIRAGESTDGVAFNGVATSPATSLTRLYGGTLNSYIDIEEYFV